PAMWCIFHRRCDVCDASEATKLRPASSDQPDAIALADRARRFRDAVDAGAGIQRTRDVDPVVLDEGLEDPGGFRKVLLRAARHDATRVGQRDAYLHVVADRERATEPLVLHEPKCGSLDNYVHTEPASIETAVWLEFGESVQA